MRDLLFSLTLASVLVVAGASSHVARAWHDDTVASDEWRGFAAYLEDDMTFAYCGVAKVDGPDLFAIAIAPYGALRVILEHEGWDIEVGREFNLYMLVDEGPRHRVLGVAEHASITFDLGTDWSFLDELRSGAALEVRGTGSTFHDLHGARDALQSAMQCAASRSRTPGLDAPFGIEATGHLTGDETDGLHLVLAAAGFEDLHFLGAEMLYPRYGGNTLAAWTAWRDVTGVMLEFDRDHGKEPRAIAETILHSAATACAADPGISHQGPIAVTDGILLTSTAQCPAEEGLEHYDLFLTFGAEKIHGLLHHADDTVQEKLDAATLGLVDYLAHSVMNR